MKPIALALLLMLPFAAPAQAVATNAGAYHISITSDPSVVPVGSAKLRLRIVDRAGKPASGLSVKVFAQMPGMPMGERDQQAAPVWGQPGTYEAPAVFGMGGTYDVRITVTGPSGTFTSRSELATGQNISGAAPGTPFGLALGIVAVVLLLALAVVRMHKAGIHADVASFAKPGVLIPLLVLAAIAATANWAVNHLRRPGAMTPLEAQGMEMSTSAPPGSLAVTLATVKRRTIASTVRYTGQVVGYIEQDVFPRVTGTLIYMPLYVGDKVRRGQAVARLDVSQLAPEVASKQAMSDAAARGFDSAKADDQAAIAMVAQAKAEHEQYMDAIKEGEANLEAAKENEAAMAAQSSAAGSDAKSAAARKDSAQADVTYQQQELDRTTKLYQAGAVSRSELQQAEDQQARAQASLADMDNQVSSARARLQAAQAGQRQAAAGTVAAQRKLAEAEHAMQIHQAHVATAVASETSARNKAAQMAAQSKQAQADLAGARADQSYATIRAQIDGVVTDRLATQGTLVQPGTSILKIAQIDPIRIQADVPASDLGLIRVGANARVWTGESSESAIRARVTSVSPSVDPTARTGIVEAVVSNPGAKLLPGQYDALEITTGTPLEALAVPNEALQEGPGGTYVWVAEPSGAEGSYTAHQVPVKTGASNGADTAALEGLSAGQQVITSGFVNLEEGATVNAGAAEPMTMSTGTPTVKVGATSFDPPSVTIGEGTSKTVVFIRTTEQTCATEVIFADFNIRQALPFNQPVSIDLSKAKPGSYTFTCPLSMFKGRVVIR